SADPEGVNLATKASRQEPFCAALHSLRKAPEVVGKSLGDAVDPTIVTLPELSTVMPLASSSLFPPRYVEYSNCVPAGLIFTTNASLASFSGFGFPAAPWSGATVWKFVEVVEPATYTFPAASIVMARPSSSPLPPPRNVE